MKKIISLIFFVSFSSCVLANQEQEDIDEENSVNLSAQLDSVKVDGAEKKRMNKGINEKKLLQKLTGEVIKDPPKKVVVQEPQSPKPIAPKPSVPTSGSPHEVMFE